MRAAPAQVAVQRLAHLVLVGRGLRRSRRHRADDHPGRAVAALGRLLVDQRLLDGVQRAVRQALDRGDLAFRGPGREVAGGPGLAVDQHEARAAQPDAAAEPRPGQAQIVPEHVEQRRVRLAAHACAPRRSR